MASSKFACFLFVLLFCLSDEGIFGEKFSYIHDCIWQGGITESLTFFCGRDFVSDRFFNYNHKRKPCVNNKDGFVKDDIFEMSFENCTFAALHPLDIIEYYRYVQKLDISNLDLKTLVKEDFSGSYQMRLRVLNVSHNHLTELGEGVLDGVKHIRIVDFSYNQIKYIDPLAFYNNTEMQSLDLSNNNLVTIDNTIINRLIHLENLYLRHNQITDIKALTFSGLETLLSNLDLSQNNLTELNSAAFEELSLNYLNLSHNRINKFDDGFFSHIKAVKILDMSYNKISQMAESFGNNIGLTDFYISNNQIKSINQFVSANINDLKILDVSNNGIMDFCDKIFDKFSNLADVNLAVNPIKKLNETIFSNNQNILHLNLSNIGLEKIEAKTFSNVKKLQSLDLSLNKLKQIDFNMFLPRFSDLRIFYVEGNNIKDLYGFRKQLFPNLQTLGIQNNNFNCSYLHNFLDKIIWADLNVDIDRLCPFTIDDTNVGGIRCKNMNIEIIDSNEQFDGDDVTDSEDNNIELIPNNPKFTIHESNKGEYGNKPRKNRSGYSVLIAVLFLISLAIFGGIIYRNQILDFILTKKVFHLQNYRPTITDTEPVIPS